MWQAARPLIVKCQLKAVPCGHLYARGKLQRKLAVGNKSWDSFKETLDALRDEVLAPAA